MKEDLIANEALGGALLVFGLMPWLLMAGGVESAACSENASPKSVEMKRSTVTKANA